MKTITLKELTLYICKISILIWPKVKILRFNLTYLNLLNINLHYYPIY